MNDLIIFSIGLAVIAILLGTVTWALLRRRNTVRIILGGITGLGTLCITLAALFLMYSGRTPESVIGMPNSPILTSVQSGEELKLDDFVGKTIVVNLWATWCAPCIAEFPHFERVQSEYEKAGNLEILLVSTETQEILESFHNNHELSLRSYRVQPDAAMFKDIQPRPVTLIFDRAGNLIQSHFGSLSYEKLLFLINGGL